MNASPAPSVDVGVLLAGGSSRRAGVDKRFLVLEGRTLLVRNLAFLRDLFPVVAVVIGREQSLDLGDGGAVEVLRDAWPGSSPLAGIATALAHFRRPVFALAVDIAFPRRDAADAVIAGFRGHDASLPAIGHEHHQSLFAVYGPTCLEPMVALLESDRHRIVDIFASVSPAEVRFPDDSLFHNINTMSDYQEARMTARASSSGAAPAGEGQPALVAIVGKNHAAITALMETLSPELVKLGLRVGTVAWRSHGLEIGRHGDDQWHDGRPGGLASVAAPERLALPDGLGGETPLADIARRALGDVDLVVAEGFERTAPHRIELVGDGAGRDAAAPGSERSPGAGHECRRASARTASLSATRPAWRDSSPRAWTRYARTDGAATEAATRASATIIRVRSSIQQTTRRHDPLSVAARQPAAEKRGRTHLSWRSTIFYTIEVLTAERSRRRLCVTYGKATPAEGMAWLERHARLLSAGPPRIRILVARLFALRMRRVGALREVIWATRGPPRCAGRRRLWVGGCIEHVTAV